MEKALRVAIVVMLAAMCLVPVAFGEESKLGKVAGFTGGFMAGFVGHELGHQVVASLQGTEMTWSSGYNKWWAHTDNRTELRNIALGGFAAEVLGSEIVLGYEKIPKDNSFVLGYLFWNIFNPLLYTVKNETQGGYGDLKTIDRCGWGDRYIETVIVGHALLSAYRLFSKKEVPIFIKGTYDEVLIGFTFRW